MLPRLAGCGTVGSISVPVPLRKGLRRREFRAYRRPMLRTARHHGRTIPALGAGLVAGAVLAGPTESVDVATEFQAVVGACAAASFSDDHGDEGHGDVQVSISELSGLTGDMAGASLTFSGTYDDGSWSATSLFGVAQDGDRVLALAQMSWDDDDTTLDPAAFTALLQQAYDVQADALD